MGDLESGDDHPDLERLEAVLEGLPDPLGHAHQVAEQVRFEVQPVVDLEPRHHQGVAGPQRPVGEEGDAAVVTPDEPGRQLTVDDAA